MGKGKPGKDNNAYLHGHTTGGFSPTYHSWASMLQRVTNPKRAYAKRYVDRGIGICERWLTFSNFLDDMGVRPAGTSLDRINNDEGYSRENCRWATRKEQANNTCATRYVVIGGKKQSITQWCRELGISQSTVQSRMRKWGYTPEEALTRPKQDRVKAAIEMTAKRIAARNPRGS